MLLRVILCTVLSTTCAYGFMLQAVPRRRSYHSWRRQVLEQTASVSCDEEEMESRQHLVWKHLLDRFQGDFDNYQQVIEGRQDGLLPREGGGHENFHCTIIPVSETGRLAAFYFDGNPQRIFRFRYYELLKSDENANVEMKLYTLHSDLEVLLRSNSEEPLKWPAQFTAFDLGESAEKQISYLDNCEVSWSLEMDPDQHSYARSNKAKDGIHAVMVHGEAIVESTMIPGIKIRILDQLSLYDDVFYINDRGLDPETGAFIYGNQRGVPYRLERVACLVDGERLVVQEGLQWTMGPQWRTEDDYNAKLDAVGGPSAKMSRPKGAPQNRKSTMIFTSDLKNNS